jgi:hypothetical protein
LGGTGRDGANTKLGEGPADLSSWLFPRQFLLEGGLPFGRDEDGVPIVIEGERPAVRADQLPKEQEVALSIFLEPETGSRHGARGIVDGGQQAELWASLLQPGMRAAV